MGGLDTARIGAVHGPHVIRGRFAGEIQPGPGATDCQPISGRGSRPKGTVRRANVRIAQPMAGDGAPGGET